MRRSVRNEPDSLLLPGVLYGMWLPLLLMLCAVPAAPAAERGSSGDARVQIEDDREHPPQRISLDEMARRADPAVNRAPLGVVRRPLRSAGAGMTWSFMGPAPIQNEYWSGNANAGGRVSSIAVDPRNAARAYLAAAQGGVWKTTDTGGTWTPLTDHLSSLASGALALDPSQLDVVYYGTGELHYSGDSFYGDGLFRSEDEGASWAKVATRASVGSYISRVVVHPTDSQLLLVSGDLGVVRSTDRGATWQGVLSGGPSDDLAFHPGNAEVAYASIHGTGMFKSTNRGATWTQLAGGLPLADLARINFAVATSDGEVVYAAFVSSSTSGLLGMYRTSNGGTTWSLLPATPNYLLGQGWYDHCIAVGPTNPNECFAGGVYSYGPSDQGIVRTTNGGASWTDITVGLDGTHPHPDQHAFAFGPDGSLWLGNDGGVWRTTNSGQSWQNRNDGLGIAQFYTVAQHPTNPLSLLGGTQDNGTVMYEGALGWRQQFGGDGGPSVYEWDSPNIFYTTYVFLSYMLRWNSGAYEADVTGPWNTEGDAADWCNGPFLADPNQPNTLLAGSNRVWRSTSSGASWSALGDFLLDRFGSPAALRSIAVALGDPDVLYAGNSSGDVFYSDDAATWTRLNVGLPNGPVTDIVLDPLDAQTAHIAIDRGTGARVFNTTSGGGTWTSITGNLPSGLRGMSLAVDHRNTPARLLLGTDYGVWESIDGGANWLPAGSGIPALAVYDLALDAANDLVTAATHGRGMWRAPLGGPQLAVDLFPASGVMFAAPYPNPGRGVMRFAFDLPREEIVKLDVYDTQGRHVRSLGGEAHTAGSHTLSWDGRDVAGVTVAEGVYHARLRAGSFERSRRLVRMR